MASAPPCHAPSPSIARARAERTAANSLPGLTQTDQGMVLGLLLEGAQRLHQVQATRQRWQVAGDALLATRSEERQHDLRRTAEALARGSSCPPCSSVALFDIGDGPMGRLHQCLRRDGKHRMGGAGCSPDHIEML